MHRIRPLLTAETKHAYLLTDVPTAVPVNDVVSFEALVDPLKALLPVAHGALEFAACLEDALARDGPDRVRVGTLVDWTGDKETFNMRRGTRADPAVEAGRHVSDHLAVVERPGVVAGLHDAGEDEQRAGARFTADGAT